MRFPFTLSCLVIAYPLAVRCISLLDALRQANASQFAQRIESNPQISALYHSDSVRTIFAPVDSDLSPLRVRQEDDAPEDDEAIDKRQCSKKLAKVKDYDDHPGQETETLDDSSNLGGNGTTVVSQPADEANGGNSSLARRHYNNATVHRTKISSGLGKNSSIIRGDIPYDGGIIHLMDA